MRSRQLRRLRQCGQLPALLLAAVPLPAFAAGPALAAWGAYLFFAIVATVVIVLLLHEALEDEPLDEGGRDERVGDAFGTGRHVQSRHGPHHDSGKATSR